MGKTLRNLIFAHQARVVQTVNNAIHQINLYPVDSVVCFVNTYLLDSDLSGGERYPAFEQLGPGQSTCTHIKRKRSLT